MLYDFEMSELCNLRTLLQLRAWAGNSPLVLGHWLRTFWRVYSGRVDTWDAQVVYTCMKHRQLAAVSNVSLIENRGFSDSATHTKFPPPYVQPREALALVGGEVLVTADADADAWEYRHVIGASFFGIIRKTMSRMGRIRHSS